MQDLSFISNMSDEDAYLFKRCVRRLLDTTFLVKDKEEKLYQFVASESKNRWVWRCCSQMMMIKKQSD